MFGLIRKLLGGSDPAPRVRRAKPEPMAAGDLRQLLLAHERTSIWLTPTDAPRFSKLGGAPDFDGDLDWPKVYSGAPMAFVAQLDLADVRAAGGPDWLPSVGELFFFTDTESINPGGGGRVVYASKPATDRRSKSAPGAQIFGECHLGMEARPSHPTTDWLNISDRCRDFDDDDFVVLEDMAPGRTNEQPDHRCAGYPSPIQDDRFALESELLARDELHRLKDLFKDPVAFDALNAEAIENWRMLLQIDTDESVGMSWYDGGRIYYFIKEDDARAGDFSKVQFHIQFN